jgi:hypothetical protein
MILPFGAERTTTLEKFLTLEIKKKPEKGEEEI